MLNFVLKTHVYVTLFLYSNFYEIINSHCYKWFYRNNVVYLHRNSPVFLIFFVIWGGFFMDIDHILLFMTKYKLFTLKKWIKITKFLYKKRQAEFYIFHSPEFYIALIVLSFFHELFFWILLGSTIHLILDIFSHYHYHKNFRFLLIWSFIYQISKK